MGSSFRVSSLHVLAFQIRVPGLNSGGFRLFRGGVGFQ